MMVCKECGACFFTLAMYNDIEEARIMVKQSAIDGIRTLPDNSTWDDIMYFLYVNQKIENGLNDIENGAVYSQSEAREKLRKQ